MKQDFWTTSTTPNYPIGYKVELGDWVARYCHANAAAAILQHRGVGSASIAHEQNTAANALSGATTISIVHATATADQFAGGYINVWNAVVMREISIKGNDVSDGVNTTLYLERKLSADVAAGTFTDVHESPWNSCIEMSTLRSAVCVPLVTPAAGEYFWGITWGPVICTAHAGAGIGAGANERQVYFWQDGSIGLLSDCAAGCQYGGFLYHTTSLGDDIHFCLQLWP